ncbi:single-stranded DNA-binding protein [Candidatus Peregrinibacteria bacterium]|nr:single-stranded DNA-binding protein [Candidatus Peregrinibacteria bacterium]
MRCVNKVILVGNLTRDPEMRQTTNGQSVCTFGLATNRDWMTKDGRKMTSTEFHDLVAWAKLGEICQQYLKKGKLVYVEGYIKSHSKVLPDGTKKFRTEIVVQDMIMLEKRARGEEEATEQKMLEAVSVTANAGHSEGQSSEGEDIFEG